MFFFNGFTVPGPSPLNVFYKLTIDIDGFSMVFQNSGAMVSHGFDLEKDLKNAHNRDRSYFATFVRII